MSVESKLAEVFNLVEEYSKLPTGHLIERHLDVIKIFEFESLNLNKSKNVLFTRRSIKHFTERRLEQFTLKHSLQFSLQKMKVLIFSLDEVFSDPTELYEEGDSLTFIKFWDHDEYATKVVVQNRVDGLFIKTVHPKENLKRNKNTQV